MDPQVYILYRGQRTQESCRTTSFSIDAGFEAPAKAFSETSIFTSAFLDPDHVEHTNTCTFVVRPSCIWTTLASSRPMTEFLVECIPLFGWSYPRNYRLTSVIG